MIPSSNPASQVDLDMGEALWLLEETRKELGCDPWDETFSKVTGELLNPRDQSRDIYIKEEVLFVDHLRCFVQRLPQLHTMLDRLRTLAVPDPLLTPPGVGLSEEIIFRYCLPLVASMATNMERCGSGFPEEFSRVSALNEESLMLPEELESCHLKIPDHTFPLRDLQESFRKVPESMEDTLSCMDMLRNEMPARLRLSAEICWYEMSIGIPGSNLRGGRLSSLDPSPPVRCRLYPQIEAEQPLSTPFPPLPPLTQLSRAELPGEQMSPVYRHCLVSDSAREEMEESLWNAEKHLCVVLGLLLAEPQVSEPVLQYSPISEALKTVTAEGVTQLTGTGEEGDQTHLSLQAALAGLTSSLGNCCSEALESLTRDHFEVAEMMAAECSDTTESAATLVENFSPLTFSQIDSVLRKYRDDAESPGSPMMAAQGKAQFAPARVTWAPEPSCQGVNRAEGIVAAVEVPLSQGTEPKLAGESGAGVERDKDRLSLATQEHERAHKPTPTRPPVKAPPSSTPQDDLDPLSTFMMLRSQSKAAVSTPTQNASLGGQTRPEPKMELEPKEQPKPRADLKPICVGSTSRGSDVKAQETSGQVTTGGRGDSQIIHVQVSESQCQAYGLLKATAAPFIASARELGPRPSTWGDFRSLSSDRTRFLLKQQERELNDSVRRGETSEKKSPLYKQVALIHLLVTARDLLLRCDLNTAVDYLTRAKGTNMDACLPHLWIKLRVVQYLSQKSKEPNPKIVELQQQMRAWLQKNRTLRPCPKAVVITTVDFDCVRALLVKSLSQVTGAPVSAVCPEGMSSKLDSRTVMESLQGGCCVVICGQHIGPDFPWQYFSLVVEYDHVDPSVWATVCRERNMSHMTFKTTVPGSMDADPSLAPLSFEKNIPFVLLVTEGLANFGLFLQMLESVHSITVLERDHPHSLKMLGGTQRYSVITVDERTAVVIQHLEELWMEQASDSFVLRMTALALQYNCCWVIFHGAEGQDARYNFSSEVFNNLVLIYSAFVLFGLKSEDLDVKVLITSEAEELAGWISQIAYHTLMSSGRDPLVWLDRDWLLMAPSEEERCLVSFPSVSPLVAQLMLRRAPGLKWLLGATHRELQDLLPEVPHKVIKLFSDTTALYKLDSSRSPPESQDEHSDPWGSGVEDPGLFIDHHTSPFHGSPCPDVGMGGYSAEGAIERRDTWPVGGG
ncbi:protein shortage in chiasmata 1 ortholog [Megalops cyprinoides]|uniref:protein shortage in chiasmata 1 ortholog n=1 Tax=Megalops cyprinoides TaxID=118141 RepID=UPI0018649E91|nr:protein shortage in chiasmata 1 ortholog [Megalops cyprinoides]